MIRIVTDRLLVDNESWNAFVKHHDNGNFFQTVGYLDLFIGIKNVKPVTLFAFDDEQNLCGILCGTINFEGRGLIAALTSRLIIIGGPLALNNEKHIAEQLTETLYLIYSSKVNYIEIRNLFGNNLSESFQQSHRVIFKRNLDFIVRLDKREEVIRRISSSKMRQIKSSLKAGASINEAESQEEVKEFYFLLSELYRKKVNKPLPPVSIFLSFFENKNLGRIFLVKKDNRILGGIVCPVFSDRTIYEWYICGSSCDEKGLHPGVLATWAPIDYGINNGLGEFDFMGAGEEGSSYGVRDFKKKFGGEQVMYGRYLKINRPLIYNTAKMLLELISMIKGK